VKTENSVGSRYMIRTDMEGVGGVVSYEQARPGAPEYARAQESFMAELVALVEGLRQGGAGLVVIYDEHYWGRNIDVARLPQGTQAICGKPPYRSDWAGGLDPSFAGMILLGLHSKDGTPGGLLPHTYEHDIADLVLNGVSIGEIGMEAAIAGDFDVPTVMITADSAGVAEATSLLPGIQTVTTKVSLGETGAVCLPLAEVTQ
jgi:D-amino peptidase